jgi:hypothetical protein
MLAQWEVADDTRPEPRKTVHLHTGLPIKGNEYYWFDPPAKTVVEITISSPESGLTILECVRGSHTMDHTSIDLTKRSAVICAPGQIRVFSSASLFVNTNRVGEVSVWLIYP